jgi:DNA polymerase-3 subunit beta
MTTKTKAPKTPAAVHLQATISREKLLEAIAAVTAAVPSKTTLPVLGNILIEATSAGIKMTTTDLDLTIETVVVADVETEGAVTIPAKRLMAIAKELPPAPVRLSVETTGGLSWRFLLDCGRAHYKLLGIPAEEFPSRIPITFGGESVKAGELSDVVRRVSFAASTEDSRPILNGVLWSRTRDAVRLVATNGHRLAFVERAIDPELGASGDYIVPTKSLAQIPRLFSPDDQLAIGMSESGNHIALRSDTTCVTTRVIEGPYPNYTKVIPTEHTVSVLVDRIALVSAVRRCIPVASDQSHRLKLTMSGGMVRLAANTPDVGECNDEIAARINGPEFSIGVDASYLLEVLGACGTDEVLLEFNRPETPIVLKPQGEADGTNALFLVMPLRLLD